MPPSSDALRLQGLLAEARWLESLARALVADPDEARDLVQEVWTTAAERAPAHVEHPRAWLATVLRNLVSVRRRARAVREVRELDRARSESLPGADDVVARAQVQRSLVDQVLALEEPWRSTVLLRFFDELSCEEIARRQQIPASTVRNRVAHALELLRARLSRVRGEDWMTALAPLALRGAWSPSGAAGASAAASTKVAAGVATSGWIGGLLMASTLKIGVALALAAGVVWWSWHALETPSRSEHVSRPRDVELTAPTVGTDAPPVPQAIDAPARTSASTPTSIAERPTPVAPSAQVPAQELPPPAGVIEGLVLEDGLAWTKGGRVDLLPDWTDAFPAEPDVTRLRTARIDERGAFRFDHLDPGDCMLRADLAADIRVQMSVELGPDAGRRVIVRIGSASLSGHAWDDDGVPRAGALISLGMAAGKVNEVEGLFDAHTDEHGAYRIEHLPEDLARGVLSQDLDSPEKRFLQHFSVQLKRGVAHTLDFGRARGLPTWSGNLVTRSGRPVLEAATIQVRDPSGRESLQSFASDGGRFRLRLAPGSYRVSVLLASNGVKEPVIGVFDVPDEDLERDLVVPGTRVFGSVTRSDGSIGPLASNSRISVHLEGHEYPHAFCGGKVAPDGSYVIDGLEPGTYVVQSYPLKLDGRDRLVIGADDAELRFDALVRLP